MTHPYWPLFDLVIRTPRLELRLPTDAEMVDLANLASAGIHDPQTSPFAIPWTDAPSPELERAALQWWWSQRATWKPEAWSFTGAVFLRGDGPAQPIGVQDLIATNFAVLGSVTTGSWLGRAYQGQGFGLEMRAAILHLAFVGLGAAEALSGAWHDNAASLNVSRKLGYVENGRAMLMRRGAADLHVGLRLTREEWEARRHSVAEIEIQGLAECRDMFGSSNQ